MVRPRVNAVDRKDKLLQIKMSEKEMEMLKNAAREAHDPYFTNFARRCILDRIDEVRNKSWKGGSDARDS